MGFSANLILKNRRLCRMLLAFAALTAAEWAFVTALGIHAFRVGGTLAVGLIGLRLLAGAISSGLVAPFQYRRKHALAKIALIRATLLGIAAVLALDGARLGVVLALVALDSVVAAVYRPAQSWLLAALARSPDELTQSAAGISVVKTLSQTAGALAAALAVAVISAETVMAGAAALMLVAFVASLGLSRRDNPAAAGRRRPLMAELTSGLSAFPVVFTDRLARPLVMASGLRTLIRGVWMALVVVVALKLLDLGSSGVGILQAAAAAGAAIAIPVTAAQIGRPRLGNPTIVSFVSAGVAITLIGVAPSAATVPLVIAWGISMAVADAVSLSLLHRLLHGGALGQTVSVMESLKLSAEAAGMLLAPLLVALFGLRPALIVAGLPLPLLILWDSSRLRQSDDRGRGRSRLVSLLHGLDLFRELDMASIEDIAARAKPLEVAAGSAVITQGDPGDQFYVIESGDAEVLIDGYRIGQLDSGRGFGERALLRDTARSATVRAVTALRLYVLERADFLEAVTGVSAGDEVLPMGLLADPGRRHLPELLSELTALSGVDQAGLERLAAVTEHERRVAGDVVVREGDQSDALYVILGGTAEVTIGGSVVGRLLTGDAFGEIGVLYGEQRTATITALEELTLLALPAAAVRTAVGTRVAEGVD